MTELFDGKEKIETAVASFKSLKRTAGWQLLIQIVEENIKTLEDQILNGFENETKDQIDRKRDKLKAYREVIGTPDYWIRRLETPDPLVPLEDDPYETAADLQKERKRKSD